VHALLDAGVSTTLANDLATPGCCGRRRAHAGRIHTAPDARCMHLLLIKHSHTHSYLF
jgi:hypothetical protein